jgi:phosphocarrier protein
MTALTATRRVTIANPEGMHLRPSYLVSKLALKYDAEVFLEKDGQAYEANSVLNLMMLGAGQGTQLVLRATGRQAEEAVDALAALIENGFRDGPEPAPGGSASSDV